MSTQPHTPTTIATEPPALPPRLGRLGPLLFMAHAGWMLPFAAAGTLIQALMTEIDPAQKVALYATLAAAGSLASMVATIVFGTLSDRTRSRFGRRNPWIATGAFVLAAASTAMSFTNDFALLVVLWMIFQIGLAVVLAPLFAVLPDRVATQNLGKASALIGAGQLIAQSLAGIIAGSLITIPREGLRWLPWLIAVVMVVFVLLSPERDNRAEPRDPLSVRALLRSFVPPKDKDFLLALSGRFLLLLSFMMILLYQLYLLTDYLGLSLAEAGGVIAVGGIVMAVSSGIATIVSGPLSDRIGRRKPIVMAASVIFALAALPLAFFPEVWAFYAFLAIGGFAYGIYIAVDQALLAEVLPSADDRAKDLGILNIANTLPQVLAPVVAGALVATVGFQPVFVIAAVLAVVSAFVLKPITRVR
ncbi:MFS transporter [Microbacterium sp. cx-59]|uniref:MFS transporter n=1 Tax=Microbacterium sp. cx-59 TaxID=2891207 RepID=UPI001E3909E1|nr:MFS transporter [Microbacterium sp. cx-59]MCC4909225.1 MFS transporter [Microbacterium sp. cx-59]